MSEQRPDTNPARGNSPGIPPELPEDDRLETGDVYTRSTEGGSVGSPGFGSVVTPPGEGGIMTRREEETEEEDATG